MAPLEDPQLLVYPEPWEILQSTLTSVSLGSLVCLAPHEHCHLECPLS